MQNKRLTTIVLTVAAILIIPLIAMQFTTEVKWGLPDFVIAAILLLGTGILLEFVLRKVKKIVYRIAICAALIAVVLLIWVELAVGIFGTVIISTVHFSTPACTDCL